MEMKKVEKGMTVEIKILGGTSGFLVAPEYLSGRRAGVIGTVKHYVGGHGGEVWWIEHNDGSGIVSAYCYNEFEEM